MSRSPSKSFDLFEMPKEIKPNFLIIGAAKAGTTALYEFLRQHQQIYMPSEVKEPSFFTNGYGVDAATYVRIFTGSEYAIARGEASTQYLYSSESPVWIKDSLGDVKIIAVLRDPAERAWSSYKWSVMVGIERAASFEQALYLEDLRIADESYRERTAVQQFFPDYLHVRSGFYAGQIKRYLDTFSRDRMRIFLYEDLVEAPLSVCREIFSFLEVDVNFSPEIRNHNIGVIPRSIPAQYWLENYRGRFELPRNISRSLMKFNLLLGGRGKPPIGILRQLRSLYKSDVIELEGLIGRDLGAWYD